MEEVETREHATVGQETERCHHHTALCFNPNSWQVSSFANRRNQRQKLL